MSAPPQSEAQGELLGGLATFGACVRRSRKDEDRWAVVEHPAAARADGSLAPAWCDAVLALYDGHNGKGAADVCVERMARQISLELAELEDKAGREDRTNTGWPVMARLFSHVSASRPLGPAPAAHRAH